MSQVRNHNREEQVLVEEEMYNAMPVSLEDTLLETVPIEQVIKRAPGTQGLGVATGQQQGNNRPLN